MRNHTSFCLFSQVEDLLQVLDYSNQFMEVGFRFSGSDSKKLRVSIHNKCVEYAKHMEVRTVEALKFSVENDMWIPMPVPKDFSLSSMKEFAVKRNRRRSLLRRDSRNGILSNHRQNSSNGIVEHVNDMDSFESYLSEHNVFREACERLQSGAQNSPEQMEVKHFDDDENLFTFKSVLSPSRAVYKRIPLVTSASLNFIRSIGKYIAMMEILDPVARQAFFSIRDLFDFYFFTVFSLFGVGTERFFPPQNVPQGKQGKQTVFGSKSINENLPWNQPPYPSLVRSVNKIRDRIVSGNFIATPIPGMELSLTTHTSPSRVLGG